MHASTSLARGDPVSAEQLPVRADGSNLSRADWPNLYSAYAKYATWPAAHQCSTDDVGYSAEPDAPSTDG